MTPDQAEVYEYVEGVVRPLTALLTLPHSGNNGWREDLTADIIGSLMSIIVRLGSDPEDLYGDLRELEVELEEGILTQI